jgi:hypothetical protein
MDLRGVTMIQLTETQHNEIGVNNGEPVRALDPATNEQYVLVPAEMYDRLKSLLAGDLGWTVAGYDAVIEAFAKSGWDDPRMDVYDSLDAAPLP